MIETTQPVLDPKVQIEEIEILASGRPPEYIKIGNETIQLPEIGLQLIGKLDSLQALAMPLIQKAFGIRFSMVNFESPSEADAIVILSALKDEIFVARCFGIISECLGKGFNYLFEKNVSPKGVKAIFKRVVAYNELEDILPFLKQVLLIMKVQESLQKEEDKRLKEIKKSLKKIK